MAIVLQSKPGLSSTTTLNIPKDWDPTWFRNLISNQLKGADVRNAVGVNGIVVSGNISSPYATIGFSAPVTLPGPVTITAPASGTTLNVGAATNGTAISTSNSGANAYVVLAWSNANGSGDIDITAAGNTEIGSTSNSAFNLLANNNTVIQLTSTGIVNVRAPAANGGALIQGYNSTLTTRTGYLNFVSGTGGGGGATETILEVDGTTASDQLSLASGGTRRITLTGNGTVTVNTGATLGLNLQQNGTNKIQVLTNGNIALFAAGGTGQIAGWGTPTGSAVVSNFPGATATLVQCSEVIARIITDLKGLGLYAT